MCGEQVPLMIERAIMAGSPPRVRGTVMVRVLEPSNQGITPACAGNSIWGVENYDHEGDHPRVCGEQTAASGGNSCHCGSPPRVRGTAICRRNFYS